MVEITAALVKQLRDKTGAGMLDCRNALKENDGDVEVSVDWLRKKGLSAAAKKSGRVAAEGLVVAITSGTTGTVVEVNAETDFVARNDQFQGFVKDVGQVALDGKIVDIEALKAAAYPANDRNVADELTARIATIGEHMALRRVNTLVVESGVVVSYMHNALAEGLGKIGVLIALESTGDAAKIEALGKKIAMHVAATSPAGLNRDDVPADLIERERAVIIDQAKASGKPDNVIEKMVEGRISKYYGEVVLLEQPFVMDGKTKIKKVLEDAAGDIGAPVTITAFERFALGEGIEKKEEDFAEEVAKMTA
ncbi:MAG: translation elongation factor Ts [Alphaproteobacteria bacterium]